MIATKFDTCQYSCAVVAHTEMCGDLMSSNKLQQVTTHWPQGDLNEILNK